jgi:hypothetical protein
VSRGVNTIKFFKIQWSNHSEEEATRESEDFLRSRHLDFVLPYGGIVQLFAVSVRSATPSKSRDEIPVRGESCDTSNVTVVATVPEW